MRRPAAIRLVLGAIALALALPSGAGAATTIGSLITKAPEDSACGTATFTNVALASPAVLKAPYDGVVVRWRLAILEPAPGYDYRLRILEPSLPGPANYKAVASGPPQSAPLAGLNVLPLSQPLPVKAGNIIALDCPNGAPSPAISFGLPGTTDAYFNPILVEGIPAAPNNQLSGQEILINADIVGVPTVAGVMPAAGPTVGGTVATITGTHLADISKVSFGGVPASSVVPVSETEARAIAPPHAAGAAAVQVTNAAGTSATAAAGAFTYVAPPILSDFVQSRRTWRLGRKQASISNAVGKRPPVGTTFTFNLSEAASVHLSFELNAPGRRVKGKCVAPGKGSKSKPACKRVVPAGALSLKAHAGANKISFQGRLAATKTLKPGSYTAEIVATNSFGEDSSSQTLRFKIVG